MSTITKRLLTVDETASVLGIGRTKAYEEIAAGRLSTVTIGAARRVPSESIDAYVELLKAEAAHV